MLFLAFAAPIFAAPKRRIHLAKIVRISQRAYSKRQIILSFTILSGLLPPDCTTTVFFLEVLFLLLGIDFEGRFSGLDFRGWMDRKILEKF